MKLDSNDIITITKILKAETSLDLKACNGIAIQIGDALNDIKLCPNCGGLLVKDTAIYSNKVVVYECLECLKVRPPIQCRFDGWCL